MIADRVRLLGEFGLMLSYVFIQVPALYVLCCAGYALVCVCTSFVKHVNKGLFRNLACAVLL